MSLCLTISKLLLCNGIIPRSLNRLGLLEAIKRQTNHYMNIT